MSPGKRVPVEDRLEAEAPIDGPPAVAALSERNLSRRMLRNTAALFVGRNLNALCRLAIAAVIARSLGTSVYGEYALIVVWLTIAEWVLDFGTVEVFVREANRAPERRTHLTRVFFALKVLQAPVAVLTLSVGLLTMSYSPRVVTAGLVASLSLFFMSGVVLARASFKASLAMEREMFAEFVSVLTMLGLVLVLPRTDLGLTGLMAAYVASRAVFLVCCLAVSGDMVDLSVRGVGAGDVRWAAGASLAIGLIGLVVVLNNATDLLILSRLASLEDVAIYSAAQRFTIPLMMGLNSIALSLYPVLALLDFGERFRRTCEQAIATTVLLSGLTLACLWVGAELLMGILGEDFVAGADVLRVLSMVSSVKALSLVLGPVLFLVGAQNLALGYMCVTLVLKVGVLLLVTPHFGSMGAAWGALSVEVLVLAPVTLFTVYRRTGLAARPLVPMRIVAIVVSTVALTHVLVPAGGPVAIALAATLYVLAAAATGAVKLSDIRALLERRTD